MNRFDKIFSAWLVFIFILIGIGFYILETSPNTPKNKYDFNCLEETAKNYCSEINETYYQHNYARLVCYKDYNPRLSTNNIQGFKYLDNELKNCELNDASRGK